ncbi:hypothetical protein J2129_000892 [Methanofollis sp. W23]|uniref:hypothetical protein n=1 Tax=Methanofollis sp. W23 TaxID=2817849 RepID=UPI001AEB9EEB|nr:hypothetical protein [Methanofollis sp. W23]MBP2145438.1 hypothetical protein [Methanofollis sp. W23]
MILLIGLSRPHFPCTILSRKIGRGLKAGGVSSPCKRYGVHLKFFREANPEISSSPSLVPEHNPYHADLPSHILTAIPVKEIKYV